MADMHQKFGPHGELVEAFLDELRSQDVDWPQFSEKLRERRLRGAVEAVSGVSWPAAVGDAVDAAARRAYGQLRLDASAFERPMSRGRVKVAISTATKAIAAGSKLDPQSRRDLLEPFVEAGFGAASAALTALDGDAPGSSSAS